MKPRESKVSSKTGSRACPDPDEGGMDSLRIGDAPLTIEALVAVARGATRLELSESARDRVDQGARPGGQWVKEGRAVYGVTTGFGALCEVAIEAAQTRALQENIIMSHAAGVGDSFRDGNRARCDGREDPGPLPGTRGGKAGDPPGAGGSPQFRGLPRCSGEGLRGGQRGPCAHGAPGPRADRQGGGFLPGMPA